MQYKKYLKISFNKGFSTPVIIILLTITLFGVGAGVKFFLNPQAPISVQDITSEIVQPVVVVEPPMPQARQPVVETPTSAPVQTTIPSTSFQYPIGYIGCSMTMNAVSGYTQQGGKKFWASNANYGGGGLAQWGNLSSDNRYWKEFNKFFTEHAPRTIWWQLCAVDSTKSQETYQNTLAILEHIKQLAPGATVYVSAQPLYTAGHVCTIAGNGGPERMKGIVDQLVVNKKALAGPVVGPLSVTQTRDGCHGNNDGTVKMGDQMINFFDKNTTTSSSGTGTIPIVIAPPSTPVVAPSATSKVLAFALASAGTQSASQIGTLLDNTAIDGVALQIGWPTLETADEVFNWTTLDASLKAAKDRKKSLTIHVFSGAGLKTAPWLKTAGVQTYTLTDFQGRTHEEALPWDETYLSQYAQFLKSLATHLSNSGYSSTVARLSVAVPVAEMDLIACKNNMLAGVHAYNRTTYLDSWKDMIDAYGTAFPSHKKFVSAPVGLICAPTRDTQFFTDVMNYASGKYGTSFIPFAADLTSEGSDRMKSYTSMIAGRGLGYQTIWSSTNDASHRMKGTFPGNLLQAVCKAKSDGADYIEIYGVDVLNTDSTIQKGIKAVHDSSLCN